MVCLYSSSICVNKLKHVELNGLLASVPGVSFNSVYTQIWRVLLHLAADPFPEVSDLAMKVLNSIAYKVRSDPLKVLDIVLWNNMTTSYARV